LIDGDTRTLGGDDEGGPCRPLAAGIVIVRGPIEGPTPRASRPIAEGDARREML
jgi:hypothetical protein